MVKKSILERFLKFKGYSYVKKNKQNQWRGIAEASKKTGISEATVRRILKEHPTAPSKGQPKYIEEFKDDEGFKLFKMKYGKKTQFPKMRTHIRRAWLLLNKKDSLTWTKDDYNTIWNSPKFYVETFKGKRFQGVPESYATTFHNLMKCTDKLTFLDVFKGKKYPKGGKKEWFLEEEEIILLTKELEENETLLLMLLGITKGARFSALVLGTPEQLNRKDSIMVDYEPKREEYKSRMIQPAVMEMLFQYIKDYDIQPKENLFTQSYSFYANQMARAGKKAGIKKTISSHIFKHTFVTQGSRHGVSAETASEQTGTNMDTLSAHYRARNEAKMRKELLGIDWEYIPFDQWIDGLIPYFKEAYNRIKGFGQVVDGVRSKIK